jgi:hypothetical protein
VKTGVINVSQLFASSTFEANIFNALRASLYCPLGAAAPPLKVPSQNSENENVSDVFVFLPTPLMGVPPTLLIEISLLYSFRCVP